MKKTGEQAGKPTEQIARIVAQYFSGTDKRLTLAAGDILFEQNAGNDRLYYIITGEVSGSIAFENETGEEEQLELFRAEAGDFLGVYSFFSETECTSTRVTALNHTELSWIDYHTVPVEKERYGSLSEQLLPVFMVEMTSRQIRLGVAAKEREMAMRRLHLAESLSTLGQLSAGLAHELNNAIGVLVSASDGLQQSVHSLLERHEAGSLYWFERGLGGSAIHSSETVRAVARGLEKRYGISYERAKTLARIMGDEPLTELPQPLERVLELWETGNICRDMHLAADHAARIIRSVKQLCGDKSLKQQPVDVNETIREALSLLQSNLRELRVDLALDAALPPIVGNKTELVQIWANIIKNGWDALHGARTPCAAMSISSRKAYRSVEVVLCNNGPQIPPKLLSRLFQPNITTKRNAGNSMGLGLGLYIVKRLVDSYSGRLDVQSGPEETRFTVRLPLRHETIVIDEEV